MVCFIDFLLFRALLFVFSLFYTRSFFLATPCQLVDAPITMELLDKRAEDVHK
jgi:hypothetical protein